MYNVLLVHDNKQSFRSFAEVLAHNDFDLGMVSNTEELYQRLNQRRPDLLLIPLELSDTSGIELVSQIRNNHPESFFYIVILANNKEDFSMVAGLESGADDYYYPMPERLMVAKVKALLRRSRKADIKSNKQGLVIDEERYLIISDGEEFYLPKKEFEILSLLHSRPNKVFSREEIKQSLWENYDQVRGRTVDVHIRKIREKVGLGLIKTIKGVGYQLNSTQSQAG